MKKFYILMTMLLIALSCSQAQPLKDIKICINPGHGGHDSDDRYIALSGFWESEGNLAKGLHVRTLLENAGAKVIMTRTQNNTSDDLPLSQIVSIANSNNASYMHAIHSNAFNGVANYCLLLFHAYDNNPQYPDAKRMGGIMVEEIGNAHRINSKYNRGDYDFYGNTSGLGVLRGNLQPATLSEGSFHDYPPESFRLTNANYLKHEAIAIARSFYAYYGQAGFSHGVIAGIVRNSEKNVTYYATGNDKFQPVNNIKVTIQPGNKICHGDANNNGFFMIDSLAPGTYKIYYEAKDFLKDSSTVVVYANKTSFADKNLLYDTKIPSEVSSYTPNVTLKDSVHAATAIQINFTRVMNKASVEAAFSISPNIAGVFSWGNEDRSLVFTPSVPYEKATKYTVTISTAAMSIYNVAIVKPFQMEFVTKNRNRLKLESSYPKNSQLELSTTLQIRLQFDAVLNSSTIENVYLLDKNKQRVSLLNLKAQTLSGKGIITFEPAKALMEDAEYMIIAGGKLKDADGIAMVDSSVISFRTISRSYLSGTVIDSFDVKGSWKIPSAGFGSTGIDTIASKFNYITSIKYRGSMAGRLAYVFTKADGGVCQWYNPGKFDVSGVTGDVGMWVKGDYSRNVLEYWFESDGKNIIVTADTLNFTGWKLVKVPMSKISGQKKYFHSIVVKQTPQGDKSNIIYVDDLQYNIVLPVEDKPVAVLEDHKLEQNYPNPFNPSTKISFQVGQRSHVSLKVFDLLGREVATLINEEKPAGRYEVVFNAEKASSGVYFYQLKAGKYTEIKKMQLMK